MRSTTVVAALLLTACAPQGAESEQVASTSVSLPCLDAPFGADASLASLQAALGAENVVEQTFETEGDPLTLTVVYPNDATRRLEVAWRDETLRQGVYKIGVHEDSAWSGPHGLSVGMPIASVQQLNGRVFDIRGLGWDFGGDVANWRGGELATASGGCQVNVNFAVSNEDAMRYPAREIVGDRLVPSDAEALVPTGLRVNSITYIYPESTTD